MNVTQVENWNDMEFGGSAMVGEVFLPRETVIAKLGQPTQVNGPRIQERWLFRFEDGMVASIFTDKKCKDGEWLVGGFGKFDKKTKENLYLRAVKDLFDLK